MRHALATLTLTLLAFSPIAGADDSNALMQSMADYMACGQQYAENDRAPTVDKARSLCVSKLDAYAKSMQAFALAAQLADGQPQDKAQTAAFTMAANARKSAETSFTNSVTLLIDLRN